MLKILPKFLSDLDCESLIEVYENKKHLSNERDFAKGIVLRWENLVNTKIENVLCKMVKEIRSEILLDSFLETMVLVGMPPGGFHILHADNEKLENGNWVPNHTPNRIFSGIVFLNNVPRTGKLEFLELGISINPTQGMLVLFPSNHEYLHRVSPFAGEMRYTMALWFSKERCGSGESFL